MISFSEIFWINFCGNRVELSRAGTTINATSYTNLKRRLLGIYILRFIIIYLHDLLTFDMFRTLLFIMVSTTIIAQDGQYTAEYHQDYGLIISHEISAGQTIYGLTKHFGGTIEHTIALNDVLDFTEVNIGDQLKFVISTHLMVSHRSIEHDAQLHFTVQKGQTLYSIAKNYAHQEVQDIMSLNELSDSNLHPGQTLILGYIERPYNIATSPMASTEIITQPPIVSTGTSSYRRQEIAVKAQLRPLRPLKSESPIKQIEPVDIADLVILDKISSKTAIDSSDIATDESYQFTHEKGLAYWQTIDSNSEDLIVLHKNAPVNESITLFNPMMGREVKATVVAPIPEKSYPANISIVISPAVAEALGALDKRFIVEMTY